MVQSYKKSLVINVKNKTKINQIDNILTFEVPFLVFLSQNYNIIGTETRGQHLLLIVMNAFVTSESEFGCNFKVYTQFYTQKLRYGKKFCDILIYGEFYK